jgi:hypothetical protein
MQYPLIVGVMCVCIYKYIYGNVFPVHIMKAWNRTSWKWGVNFMFHLIYPCEKIPEPIAFEASRNPQPILKFWSRTFCPCCNLNPRQSTLLLNRRIYILAFNPGDILVIYTLFRRAQSVVEGQPDLAHHAFVRWWIWIGNTLPLKILLGTTKSFKSITTVVINFKRQFLAGIEPNEETICKR